MCSGCCGMCRPLHCASLPIRAQLCSLHCLQANVVSMSDSWELTGGPVPSYLSPQHCACRAGLCRTLLVEKSFSWLSIPPDLFQRHLLLGRKAMTNLDHILKSRDITLPTKVYIVKAVVFPVVIYECESWTIKKVE